SAAGRFGYPAASGVGCSTVGGFGYASADRFGCFAASRFGDPAGGTVGCSAFRGVGCRSPRAAVSALGPAPLDRLLCVTISAPVTLVSALRGGRSLGTGFLFRADRGVGTGVLGLFRCLGHPLNPSGRRGRGRGVGTPPCAPE